MTLAQRLELARFLRRSRRPDHLSCARGVINGALIGAAFWALLVLAIIA